jgi:hypothetical protein
VIKRVSGFERERRADEDVEGARVLVEPYAATQLPAAVSAGSTMKATLTDLSFTFTDP